MEYSDNLNDLPYMTQELDSLSQPIVLTLTLQQLELMITDKHTI